MDNTNDLEKAMIELNEDAAIRIVKNLIDNGTDLIQILDCITSTARNIGEAFKKGELWLPDLMATGSLLTKALPLVEEELKNKGKHKNQLGTVVIGTVRGDIHNTGKNMVSAFLIGGGFKVYDLGENVTSKEFVAAVYEHKADILAMSALMTTTLVGLEETIGDLFKEGIRDKLKILVGGAPITQEYADSIGADGYDPTAVGAVELAKRVLMI